MGKIVAVCSGSGGTGKSTVALSLAAEAAKRGRRTILLDASGASRSCDLMLGLESIVVLDMFDVVKQQASVHSALYPVPGRKNLMFACASLYEEAGIGDLSGILLALRAMCELLVIDLPTGPIGICEGVLDQGDAFILLTRPDDVSIRALERVLASINGTGADRYLVLNQINAAWVKKGQQYDSKSVEMLLDIPVSCAIAADEHIPLGMKKGKTAIEVNGRFCADLKNLVDAIL